MLIQARFPQDHNALRTLFLGYIEALCAAMPEDRAAITAKYNPDNVSDWLVKFSEIHCPPHGCLLIHWENDQPLGCGMLREFEPGIAEIQRPFISEHARGRGLARQISLALMDHARAVGFHTIRLDTARPLTGAIALYRSLGFKERSPYHNLTPQMDHFIVYFERPL
ncbi:GNAT family N-acetyltransferase [Pseudorhodobacter wandonensis]|uniref:GNAT family N-acetyltransferase n=1 Tax=Pseudorhodobacter wandonensis TaxID=1120568 RepID=UPI00067D955D|nr:GNAT family N-acetyltransferase [Pseudorhodobacter wandonensis]